MNTDRTQSEAATFNDVLDALGSSHRVYPGSMTQDGLLALAKAIPPYIDRVIEEKLAKRVTDASSEKLPS